MSGNWGQAVQPPSRRSHGPLDLCLDWNHTPAVIQVWPGCLDPLIGDLAVKGRLDLIASFPGRPGSTKITLSGNKRVQLTSCLLDALSGDLGSHDLRVSPFANCSEHLIRSQGMNALGLMHTVNTEHFFFFHFLFLYLELRWPGSLHPTPSRAGRVHVPCKAS
jgi:hypothetical protein